MMIGEKIRWLRKHALGDISQFKLGELVDRDRQSVNRWENNKQAPEHDVLERLAELSGKPLAWFFQPPPPPGVADDRHPYERAELSIGEVLVQALRRSLDEPTWTEEGAAAHQGELLARARQRLGINQEVMGDQVLGWGKRRLAQVEKGHPLGAEELAYYLQVLGISLDPLAWYGPTEVTGRTTSIEIGSDGQAFVEPVRYRTKVELERWCPTCELFRLLYPDFCCSAHRGTEWEIEEAMRRLKRARAVQARAEQALEKALRERKRDA